jgi:hypothetical protein
MSSRVEVFSRHPIGRTLMLEGKTKSPQSGRTRND